MGVLGVAPGLIQGRLSGAIVADLANERGLVACPGLN